MTMGGVSTWLRKGVSGVALATALFALSACGEEPAATDKLKTGPIPESKTELTVWSFLPGNYEKGAEAYNAIAADFQKAHPQVTVTVIDMPYGTYFDQVRNAVVAQSGPDVITMYGSAQAYSYKNGLYPLQDAIDATLRPQIKYLDENYSADGNLYILPTGSYGYVMLVNRAMFAQAGIDPAAGLASWNAMLATCKALTEKGIQPMASGWKDGYLFETYLYMITSQMMDKAALGKWVKGELKLDDKLFTDAVNYIMDMKNAGCFGDDKALGRNMFDDTTVQYASGGAAILVNGTMSSAMRLLGDQPETMAMALPQVPASKHKNLVDAGAEAGWSVTKWTKSPEASAAFVNFIASKETQEKLWGIIGVPPNITGFQAQAQNDMQAAYMALLANPENHTGFAAFPLPVLAVMERNAAPLMGGTMTVQQFMESAQAAFAKTN
ncbi:extracellular solute-binding protein [Nordella sp. HKS 07]|uniref:ABC transporter substrate-binding protein n=1 Tax=Nordella sp. HKS 07 TaxID=2712222 RepID=UPI0013E0EC82|nr:extracellular solute-binding protein [Nordella sp. HKS 07]QIG51943.1 extracellular solute-binding protein [Nordella sp. HKS 07]